MSERILIGASACLLGDEVRYDGSHKKNSYLLDTLGDYFDFTRYCPEMAIGLGVPRPTIRLIERDGETRLVDGRDNTIDHTEHMIEKSREYCDGLGALSGYVLKSRSPSCGMERVNLFNIKEMPSKRGVGIFAAELMRRFPELPVEEEGRLNDLRLRENFIERVFTYYRWQQMMRQGLSVGSLMEFHRIHKFILLAHDENTYRKLGPLVAAVDAENLAATAREYIRSMMLALKQIATAKKHMNVLQHVMGFLKNDLAKEDKQELLDLLERYRLGKLPLIVPLTLLNHHLRRYPNDYISEQLYMNPYPEELMLRNHV